MLERIVNEYGYRVRLVVRDFPLSQHANARKAAEAAEAAREQGKYWEMHDVIFANQSNMGLPALKQYAATMKLDTAKFDQCVDSGKHAAGIAEDMKTGEQMGVGSTPTLYINGRPVLGAQPFEYFKTVIDEELARVK